MDKETSSRVSSIAAEILNAETLDRDATKNEFNILLEKAQTLAGSALSQDETPGQEKIPDDFLGRLKKERAQLSGKLDALTIALDRPSPLSPRHTEMLRRQSTIMSEYLAVLDERLADLAIEARSATENENDE